MAEAAPHGVENANAAVRYNLENADKLQGLDGEVHAATESHGGPADHGPQPSAYGINAAGWVSMAMLALILLLIVKKVPSVIVGALDGRIADIRKHLDEAARLRAEAEALRGEYEKKLQAAAQEANDIRSRAEEDATLIVSNAKNEAAALVKRRQKMAEEKIAAAERAAVADIRAKTVAAATAAATQLISQGHDASIDRPLVDKAIKAL